MCKVDYVPFEDKVEAGEWFYTSGDDRVFPRGFAGRRGEGGAAGHAVSRRFCVEPSGMQHGLEDVLIILESVHQAIPDAPPRNQPVYIAPPPPQPPGARAGGGDPANPAAPPATRPRSRPGTEADKLRSVYKSVGDAQKHKFGEGAPGTKPPDFTQLPATPLPPAQRAAGPGSARRRSPQRRRRQPRRR